MMCIYTQSDYARDFKEHLLPKYCPLVKNEWGDNS